MKGRDEFGSVAERVVTTWCERHARPWVPPHRYAYHSGALHPFAR